jgi:hypothetical protein
MNSGRHFAIVYSSASAKSVSRFVTRGFFGPRELPQAFARMILTGEFRLFVGIPIAFLFVARFVPNTLSSILTGIAVSGSSPVWYASAAMEQAAA